MPNIKLIELYLNSLKSPKTRYFVLIFTVIYIISPIDLIPDFFFPFGEIDDGTLLILMTYGMMGIFVEKIKENRKPKLKR